MILETRDTQMCGVCWELGAWNALSPWRRTPSEPQRECGQANWGYLFYFILVLLGLFFIEKPSGLWTINHLSQRLILPLFSLPYSNPRHSPKEHPESSTIVFSFFDVSSHVWKSGKLPTETSQLLQLHCFGFFFFFKFQICEWVLKYK